MYAIVACVSMQTPSAVASAVTVEFSFVAYTFAGTLSDTDISVYSVVSFVVSYANSI